MNVVIVRKRRPRFMREITGTRYRTPLREKEDKGVDPWSLRMKRKKPLMVQKLFLTTV